ncbi:MAG: type VI secretion system baseplate subunit TssG [Acidobacteriia bacterium]|nr:type VI secretion system baseplate subunit TssG [Terriglobia bacterium]
MAPESGTENPPVTPPAPLREVERDLREHAGRFEFFQAVRLMLRIFGDREVVGGFTGAAREAVRFQANNSLAFPPSEIQSIDWEAAIPAMTVNFMGLTGPLGVLPRPYSELIIARLRNRDRTLAAFFDIFNHRMISLFYQAWEKYRSAVAYERDGEDRLSQYLMSLIGLGTPGLQNRLLVKDESLLFYAGLLSLQPRSAVALQHILEDYFEVPAEVEQFVGAWQPLDPASQCGLAGDGSFSGQLGVGAVVGDEIWDQQSRIRLKLGPLTQEQYLGFLPSGAAYEPLRTLTRFFCGTQLEIEVQLILERVVVPRCDLGEDSLAGPRLGWFTWMKSGAEFDRAPDDTVLLLA